MIELQLYFSNLFHMLANTNKLHTCKNKVCACINKYWLPEVREQRTVHVLPFCINHMPAHAVIQNIMF